MNEEGIVQPYEDSRLSGANIETQQQLKLSLINVLGKVPVSSPSQQLMGIINGPQGKGSGPVLSCWLTYTASGLCQALETEVSFLSYFTPHTSGYYVYGGCPHLIRDGLNLQDANLLWSFSSKHIHKMLRNDEFQERGKALRGKTMPCMLTFNRGG